MAAAYVAGLAGAWILYGVGCQFGILLWPPESETVAAWSRTGQWTRSGWWWAPLLVLSAAVEELLFRRLVLGALLLRYVSPRWAVTLSAVVFGLAHGAPQVMLGAFAVGIVLGWWFFRARSLALCIALHVGINALGAILKWSSDATQSDVVATVLETVTPAVLLVESVAGVLLVAVSFRYLRAWGRQGEVCQDGV